MSDMQLFGGCQCGAIRYRLDMAPFNIHICHCRMCQKAVGGPFAVICPVLKTAFHVTRGAMRHFASSDIARRGFCGDCGTPMTFEYPHAEDLGVLAGTFDRPELVPPVIQYGNESRVSWWRDVGQIPGDATTYRDNPQMLARIKNSNHQHPDHEA